MGHGLMCAEVALSFRHAARSNPGHELLDWECDWQAFERLGAKLVVPDAHLVYSTKVWVLDAFIEVDLATEGSRVFAWKIRRYLDLYRGGTWRKKPQGLADRSHRRAELGAGADPPPSDRDGPCTGALSRASHARDGVQFHDPR